MKKFIALFVSLTLALSFVGCSFDRHLTSQERNMKKEKDKVISSAKELIKNYLELNMQGRVKESYKYFSKDQSEKKDIRGERDIFPIGYYIDRLEYIGKNVVADVELYLSQKAEPYYIIQRLRYTMTNEASSEMKIISIDEANSIAFFAAQQGDKKVLLFREGDITNKNSVFDSQDFPPLISINSSSDPGMKVRLDKKEFGAVAISKDRNEMAVVSNEGERAIVLTIDKSISASTKELKVAKNDENRGGIQDSLGIESEESASKAEVVALDCFENSIVEHLGFSPGGDVIFARVKDKKSDKNSIAIYSVISNKISAPRAMERFNSNRYNILNSYFNDDNILILIVENLRENKEEKFEINIQKDEIVKLTN